MHRRIRIAARAEWFKGYEASFAIVPYHIERPNNRGNIHRTGARRAPIAIRKMEVRQHVAGIENRSSDMCLLRLHVVNIAIDRSHARVSHTSDVSLRILYSVRQACLGGANRLDRRPYSVFGK